MCGEKLERQIKIGRQKKSCEQQLQITRVTFSFSYFLSQMCIAFPCAAVPQAGRPRQHTQQPTRPKSPEPGASLPCAHFSVTGFGYRFNGGCGLVPPALVYVFFYYSY
jgi:hypothetical protein